MQNNDPRSYAIRASELPPLFEGVAAHQLGIGPSGFVISCAECPAIYPVEPKGLAEILSLHPSDQRPCFVCPECVTRAGLVVLTVHGLS